MMQEAIFIFQQRVERMLKDKIKPILSAQPNNGKIKGAFLYKGKESRANTATIQKESFDKIPVFSRVRQSHS